LLPQSKIDKRKLGMTQQKIKEKGEAELAKK